MARLDGTAASGPPDAPAGPARDGGGEGARAAAAPARADGAGDERRRRLTAKPTVSFNFEEPDPSDAFEGGLENSLDSFGFGSNRDIVASKGERKTFSDSMSSTNTMVSKREGSYRSTMGRSHPVATDPDSAFLLRELEDRFEVLKKITEQFPESQFHDSSTTRLPGATVTVTVSLDPAQRRSLCGLEGNVRNLMDRLGELENRQRRKEMINSFHKETEDEDDDHTGLEDAFQEKANVRRMKRSAVCIPAAVVAAADAPKDGVVGSTQQMAFFQIYGGVMQPRWTSGAGAALKTFSQVSVHANMWTRAQASAELTFLPKEFARLGPDERRRLAEQLSWEGLASWGFNAFEVERRSAVAMFPKPGTAACQKSGVLLGHFSAEAGDGGDGADTPDAGRTFHGCPLLLVGWAVLSSPYSQLAMAKSANDPGLVDRAMKAIRRKARSGTNNMAQKLLETMAISKEEGKDSAAEDGAEDDPGGYFFPDEFDISPRDVCSFLRRVEREYAPRAANPYHCNIHAADVVQATHALLRLGGPGTSGSYTLLELYAILLAAALHDIRHPGINNNYHLNAMTDLALRYNDQSVLENMHASRASALLNPDVRGEQGEEGTSGILGVMTKEQRRAFRKNVITAILYTDMSQHFSHMGAMGDHVAALEAGTRDGDGVLDCIGEAQHAKAREAFLPFVLHMADVSNPARPTAVSAEWTKGVYEEFFLQGDREKEEGLPVSPLCDRAETCPYDAQVGFMKFVIKPAFALLARVFPAVEDAVLPHMEDNFDYWKEKAKEKDGSHVGCESGGED